MIYYLNKEDFKKYSQYSEVLRKNYSVTGDKDLRKEYEDLEKILSKVKVIDDSEKQDNVIYVGDKVEIVFDGEEEKECYNLVIGFPKQLDEVSISSPVGEALVQRNIGESRKYTVNGKTFGFTIVGKQSNLIDEDSNER